MEKIIAIVICLFSLIAFGFYLGVFWERFCIRKSMADLAESFLALGLVADVDEASAKSSLNGLLAATRSELIVRELEWMNRSAGARNLSNPAPKVTPRQLDRMRKAIGLSIFVAFAASFFPASGARAQATAPAIQDSKFKIQDFAAIPDSGFRIPDSAAPIQNCKFKIQDAAASPAAFLPVVVQSSPRPRTGNGFWALALADGGLTGLDIWSSHRDMEHPGFYEQWSAWELGRHPGLPRLALTLAAEEAAWTGGAWLLDRRGHHRLARIALAAKAGLESSAIANNLILYQEHVH